MNKTNYNEYIDCYTLLFQNNGSEFIIGLYLTRNEAVVFKNGKKIIEFNIFDDDDLFELIYKVREGVKIKRLSKNEYERHVLSSDCEKKFNLPVRYIHAIEEIAITIKHRIINAIEKNIKNKTYEKEEYKRSVQKRADSLMKSMNIVNENEE